MSCDRRTCGMGWSVRSATNWPAAAGSEACPGREALAGALPAEAAAVDFRSSTIARRYPNYFDPLRAVRFRRIEGATFGLLQAEEDRLNMLAGAEPLIRKSTHVQAKCLR
jgi:hypothetical protein